MLRVTGNRLELTGLNFTPTGNQVWFTRRGAGDGTSAVSRDSAFSSKT